MNRGEIKTAIKNQVDDQSVTDTLLNEWIQAADDRVQIWRPPADQSQSFDYWDYLKDQKNYTTVADQNKYPIPDEYRAFIELKVGDDAEPYWLVDFLDREEFDDHIVWILGKFFYVKKTPSVDGDTMVFTFALMSDAFVSDSDEPEIERPYHQAHVAFGKSRYYNQQGDTELENQNLNEFEKIMMNKWRDQEQGRMASARESASIPKNFLV